MALSQASNLVEKLVGHRDNAETVQNVSNPGRDRAKYGDPTQTMKALCWTGKNSVEIKEVPKPVLVEDRDVILKVTGSTLCGSDLHLLHGAIIELQKGDILGHEFCGVIESMGPKASKRNPNFHVGDRVVCSFQIGCGDCMYCEKKLSSQCEKTNSNTIEHGMYGGNTAGMFGYSHFAGGHAGGQAEYVRVPFGDNNLLKLPDDVPDEKGLYLSDVLATSWHCVVDTGVKDGDVVAIWGAGPIGQMCADFAFLNGASRVIMVDQNWRLDLVKAKNPKIETVDFTALPKGTTVTSKLMEMVHSGPDVCLECVAGEYAKGWGHYFEMQLGLETDTSEIVNELITSCRSFGRVGITGIYAGFVRFIGNGQAPVLLYWDKLLKMIQSGEIDPSKMLSHRIKLEDLDKVYYKFEKREDGIQKIFVQTKFSGPPAPGTPPLTNYS
ncbi:hypothetical protein FH972_020995 [Carpinus fangiana]|uniref:Alcohol dehydrogenase-like N-terminal domain-containing protein n=1 Tax=Carpinus fangiana TaxID=176857 RepID=A0A5N6KN94_9ROSI|nr:hypothetical protein FH972_020995 [Carpinus fangiana]